MIALLALPVIVCATTDGLPDRAIARLPAAVELALDADLTVYSSDEALAPYVVAPRGLACAASIGADGTLSIETPAMKLLYIPGCLLCQLARACAYFPAAAKQLRQSYPQAKCARRRKGARVFWDEKSGAFAEATCTLGARCGKLLAATMASIRYRDSSRRGRASR